MEINNNKILFFIFSLFILESFEAKTKPRILQNDETDITYIPVQNSTIYEPNKPKPTLLGFGNYKERKEEKRISFDVFIKKVRINDNPYNYILFTIILFFKNLRELADTTTYKSIPVKGQLNQEQNNNYYYTYNVKVEEEKFGKDKNIDTINFKNDFRFSYNEEIDDNVNEINIPKELLKINIKEQIDSEPSYVDYLVYDLKNDNKYKYELYGHLTFVGIKPKNVNKGDIIINYITDDDEKMLNGSIDKKETNHYFIKFELKEDINTNLDGAYADISKLYASTLRNLDSTTIKLYLSETKDNQLYINQKYIEPETKAYFHKTTSSSGLSGGIIAVIVIVSIVVLIITALALIYLNKYGKSQPHSSAIELYNSSAELNQN